MYCLKGAIQSVFEVGLLTKFPLLGTFGMVVDLGLFDALRLESSDHLKSLFQVGNFANRVLEPANLNEILHPSRLVLKQA